MSDRNARSPGLTKEDVARSASVWYPAFAGFAEVFQMSRRRHMRAPLNFDELRCALAIVDARDAVASPPWQRRQPARTPSLCIDAESVV